MSPAAHTPEVRGDILQYVASCHFPSLLAALEADATLPKGAKLVYDETRKTLYCKRNLGLVIVVE